MFFDEEYLTETELNQLVSPIDKQNASINNQSLITVKLTCSSSGRGTVLLGDTNGYVYIVNRYLKVNSFRANLMVTSHVKLASKSSIFITCGADEPNRPLIKLWDMEKLDRLNQPTCIRVIQANTNFTQSSDVTCIECNNTLSLVIVGYKDGSIVHHVDIIKHRRFKSGRPMRISQHSITCIVIRGENLVKQNPASSGGYLNNNNAVIETTAFITTKEEIFHANFSDKSFSKKQIDEMGCEPRASCMLASSSNDSGSKSASSGEKLFAVGRDSAVYFYYTDGRGPCLAFVGHKMILYRFKSYLVMVSRETSKQIDTNRAIINRWATTDDKAERSVQLNIYDTRNKFIAHSSEIPDVQELFSEWGQLFVVTVDGRVISLKEKDTQTKLDTLFKKNQFSLVIDIAKSHQYDEEALTDIFKHYGDHLHRKGDYEGAIQQYIKTIGKSEPSYVIKKFLDSKRISHLTVYLEALHKRSQASQDHTKLLLNCYSKLRSDHQLKQFIESYEAGNIEFDVEIAIKVLRDAGFYELALYLAKKHHKHESFFSIQFEDRKNSEAALEYMDIMTDPDEMATFMEKYGRTMLKQAPDRTIQMIKTICQRSHEVMSRVRLSDSNFTNMVKINRQINPEEFLHIFVENNALFVQLLEQLVDQGEAFATRPVYNLLLEFYLDAWRKEKDVLLKNMLSDKIDKLLSQPSEKFDLNQALILCRNSRFDDGLMKLYGRVKLYHLILQYYIDQDDSLKIIKTSEQYGNECPNLYMPALVHYAKTGDARLTQILKAFEHHKLVPPMMVIKILLESTRANLGSVKDYMIRFLRKLYDKIIDNENAIDHYKDDTEVVRQRIEEFKNHQTVFKPSKCSACQSILDLPSVHFLCSHSYHQNCFHNYSAETDECPICVTTNRKLLNEIGSHETSRSTPKELDEQLSAPADDIFDSLAKLFGYGHFN